MKKMVNKEKDIFAITEIGLREEIIIIIILLKGADAVIGSFGYSEKRNRIVDYPYATSIAPFAVMIPKPTAQKLNHLSAIGQPFQPFVRKQTTN